ncbi:MAG TPA: hypothetical protein VKT72_05890 [Candidatus Baltobacteraceae bacterium]|nr:hypothetical protein [Candidatus Baltobacteraceae bacterium]
MPDTHTVSQKQGFQDAPVPGIVVLQDQTQRLNQTMQTALKTIASVRAVYTVSGQELTAKTNKSHTAGGP